MFPYPVTVTLVQFTMGSILVLSMWGFNLYKRPKISGAQVKRYHGNLYVDLCLVGLLVPLLLHDVVINFFFLPQLAAILPLAVVHTLGNLFTNMSLGKVAVSFTHTIKAMEPFFSVVLSAMFLGEVSFYVLFDLFEIAVYALHIVAV